MSILQEYERIRRDMPDGEFERIERFLAAHPEKLLSDVYYNAETWREYALWTKTEGRSAQG